MALTLAQHQQFETEHYAAAAFLLKCELENELDALENRTALNDWQTRRLAELRRWKESAI